MREQYGRACVRQFAQLNQLYTKPVRQVEAGDIILKVNGTDVHRYTTKEVLKCLRLSGDPVTLELKRDPKIKAHIKKYLANTSNQHHNSDQPPYASDQLNYSNYSPASSPSRTISSSIPVSQQRIGHRVTTSDPAASTCRPSRIPSKIPQQHSNSWSAPQSPHHQAKQKRQQLSNIPTPNGAFSPNSPLKQPPQSPQSEPPPHNKAPRFEAYMMTGDLILHLSRTPQSSGLIQPHAKKVDSLRDSPKHALSSYGIDNGKRKNGAAKAAPHAKYDSSLSSSNSLSEEEVSIESVKKSTIGGGATSHQNNSPSHNAAYGTYNVKQKQHHHQQPQQQQPIVDYNNSKDNNLQQINKLERNSHSDIVINKSNSRNLNNDILDMDSINDSSSSSSYPNKDSVVVSGSGGGGSNSFLDEELLLSSGQSQEIKSELAKNLHNINQKSYENDDDVDCYMQKSAGPVIAAKYSDKQRRQLSQPQRSESLSSSSSTNRGGGGSSSSSHDAGDDEDDISYSVPTSPTSLTTPILQDSCCCTAKKKRDLVQAISAPTSPETSSGGMSAVPATASQDLIRRSCSSSQNHTQNGITRTCDAAGFRTSKSEDHLQHTQHRDGGIGAAIVPIDIDEDVNSSLNTLLDTRHDSSEDNSDRIVWTYNAPQASGGGGGITSPPISHSPHTNSNSPSSPQRTDSSVASPTSVSSSIMSSSGSRNGGYGNGGSNPMTCSGNSGGGFHSLLNPQNSIGGGEMSISEAISNISSPDYQDEHDLPSSRDLAMALTDPSDSDSTLLVSETTHQVHERDRDKARGKRHKSTESKNLFTYDLPGGLAADYDNQDNRQPSMIMMQPDLKDSEDELATLTEDIATTLAMGYQEANGRDSSPPISDDGSDVDSLHSFHYSPKAVDLPSAIRLAKRLYSLDGFKKSDVSRHLSKNNEFSRAVADEYLKYFLFERLTLDEALRQFLKQFALSGETQERERVLVHFSKRYLDCNPGTFNSQATHKKIHAAHKKLTIEQIKLDLKIKRKKLEVRQKDLELKQKKMELKHLQRQRFKLQHLCDVEVTLTSDKNNNNQTNDGGGDANRNCYKPTLSPASRAYLNELLYSKANDAVHTLTCAIMLLNTDLHGPNIGRKMTCNEFIENLSELNDGENFPKDVLKQLYYSIKNSPLEWAVDDESPDKGQQTNRSETGGSLQGPQVGPNPFLEPQVTAAAVEYKKGYVMRKCCFESNYKKTAFGKRSWKMFYCTLRDLVLYLHKDEHGFRKNQMSDNVHNAIRIHHALATKANDYTKKQHVFRLQTADQSEYLFQTSDSKELQSWIDTINLVCAAFSAPPLEGGVGSQKRFQRPLLPCTHTKLLMKEQLNSHEEQFKKLEALLAEHKRGTLPTKGLALQNYREKETYLQYELKRYKTYVYLLGSRLNADPDSVQDDCNDLLLKPRPPSVPPTTTNLHLNLNVAGMAKTSSTSPTSTPTGAGAGALQPISQQLPLSPKSQTATNRDETKK